MDQVDQSVVRAVLREVEGLRRLIAERPRDWRSPGYTVSMSSWGSHSAVRIDSKLASIEDKLSRLVMK
jgi:hypothetical protein